MFSDSSSHVYHFSKQSTMYRPTSHFLQKYSVLLVSLCSEHTRQRHGFPLEGQCCECFTSSWLSWDAVGLGLPLEMPLAVTISSRQCIINSQTRISRKFFCASFCRHLTYEWEMHLELSCPLSEKTVSWSTSTFCEQFHSCWPFCLTCPQTPCMHCSLLQHEVW